MQFLSFLNIIVLENGTENEKKKESLKFFYSFEVNFDSEFNLNVEPLTQKINDVQFLIIGFFIKKF